MSTEKSWIMITGASSGIGEACASAFAEAGYSLVLAARRLERLEALGSTLRSRHGVEVVLIQLDVSDRAAVEEAFSKNRELLGKVEVLVNNAGLARGLDPIQDGDPGNWDAMIDTNIKGLLYVTRGVLPLMLERKRGHIIHLGSVAGRWNYPKGNVYAATKFAVRSLTESMRLDLAGTPIRVTEIAPGMVETEFSEVRFGGDKERAQAVYAGMKPLSARDVADAVLWSATRPAHVNIQEIVLYPVDQASPTLVQRQTVS